MATLENGEIIWSEDGVDVVYWHTTDNFEVWVRGEYDSRGEFNKSSNAIEAAQNLPVYEG